LTVGPLLSKLPRMKSALLLVVACACGRHAAIPADAAPGGDASPDASPLPAPIAAADFMHPLDRAYIRSLQTWIDDPTFATKWTAMLTSPIAFLGSADSAFHADLASRAARLPGGEVICHGDAKLDNFGWMLADGQGVFSDNDFDDGGACPAAADILHELVSTDLFFGDPSLDTAVLDAYIATLEDPTVAIAIDPATEPDWPTLRSDGVDKATHGDTIALGGEVQAITSDERAALAALVAADPRFPTTLVDAAQDVRTDGGSAGLRRYWVLVEDAAHPRTIIELKELAPPGTESGPHSTTYDGPDRFDVLKAYWWGTPDLDDHFGVDLLGARFLARDKFRRKTLDPSKLSASQIENALTAEASLLAVKHRAAWTAIDPELLRGWLRASAATLTARWRGAYHDAGGT
jgi:hypothetical protein